MMWQIAFSLALSVAVGTALLVPNSVDALKVDSNYLLGLACFFVGLSTQPQRFADLAGTELGLGNVAFSYIIGTFLWPALGVSAALLALQHGLPFAVAVGLALLAACPVGCPSNAVNIITAGGSLECSVLMCFVSTPAALITLPYTFRHFLLLLLDQPLPIDAAAAAADTQFRSEASASLDFSVSVVAALRNHAIFAASLPLAAGAVASAFLPAKAAVSARYNAPMVAAAIIVLTASTRTAAGADAVAAGGPKVIAAVALLHVVAMVLGYLIPAGVGSPGRTCRTTAYQASMRNSALGLGLVTALFGGSPFLPQVAAPAVASIFVQNTLGAWTALAWGAAPVRRPVSESGMPLSPQAFRATSMESILRQQTFRRPSGTVEFDCKED